MFQDYPAAETVSGLYFTVDSATAQYPTDGVGGATTTAGSSSVAGILEARILGFILETHDATSNLLFLDGAGNTLETYTVPDATKEGDFVPFSQVGQRRLGSFGGKLSAGAGKYQVYYQVIKR